jgi:hypothetical protein
MIEGTDDTSYNPVIELQPLLRNGERPPDMENPRMLLVRDPNASLSVGVSINFPSMDAVASGSERRTGNSAPPMSQHQQGTEDADGYGNVEMTEEYAY